MSAVRSLEIGRRQSQAINLFFPKLFDLPVGVVARAHTVKALAVNFDIPVVIADLNEILLAFAPRRQHAMQIWTQFAKQRQILIVHTGHQLPNCPI